ncbi:hypothetical protein AV530_000187 [Patagioenas fasciata monilis]|uniref:Uncharacterized protein n=1 Tax=Patagioenas fasciata monilis TaxID=372326 RepID=A0A1V4J4W8_PATFA|nr:hypothetical protein AV530_000187 [Patagioenas fasciata monilis]
MYVGQTDFKPGYWSVTPGDFPEEDYGLEDEIQWAGALRRRRGRTQRPGGAAASAAPAPSPASPRRPGGHGRVAPAS